MRIHRVEVEAFGPYAERVVVDLDAASAAGLFLVHGPTGAGKSSLLDAVCFALYADVPGARRALGLRSDHAAPGVAPQVRVDLTVGGRRLRFTRSPEWQRPKKRGTGTTKQQARVVLEEHLGGSWTALSTRHDEVGEVVKDVLGMGLTQFATVVLLPQGEFAAFLRATPEDRRAVLERLFDISGFAGVETWLADARRTSAAELAELRSALDADLAVLDETLAGVAVPAAVEHGPDDEPAPGPLAQVPAAGLPDRLDRARQDVGARVSAALVVLDGAESAEASARTALAEATRTADLRRRGRVAAERLETLRAHDDEHRGRVDRLARADAAAGLRGHLAALDRADAELAQARAASEGLAVALPDRVADDPPELALRRLRDVDPAVDELREAAREAGRLRRELSEATARHDELAVRLERLTVAVEEDRRTLEDAETEAADLAELAGRAGELRARLGTVRTAQDALAESTRDAAALVETRQELLAARERAVGAREAVLSLRERRLASMAAELADGLADGEPCPVCGASAHPDPAVASDRVHDDEIATAEDTFARVDEVRGALEGRVGALEAAIEARGSLVGDGDGDALDEQRRQVETELAASERAGVSLADATRAAARLRDAAGQRTRELERVRATRTTLAERMAALETEAGDVADRAERARQRHAGCPCGSDDPRVHDDTARRLDERVSAEQRLAAAATRREAAAAELASALSGSGIADEAAARGALLAVAEVDRLRDAVLGHDRALDAARSVLEETEVAAALAGPVADLPALEAALRDTRRSVLAASDDLAAVRRAAGTLDRLLPQAVSRCAALTEESDRHALLRELADAVGGTGGDNTLKMRLTSFVLAARLEAVAARANERLAVMGAGRYALEHSDARAARGARSGLGLRVLDQWTGRSRETSTLSGGESFMASLALALGLADVVREEAGGRDLGTLFIDEGFGSLDDDSLEQVLAVLDGLRDGGRAVGVVSHVADLRSRIPHQVLVRKTLTGSTAEVLVAGGAPAA